MPQKTYDLIDPKKNCAHFSYHGKPRVVRVISIENGNITGYETRKGQKRVNKRYAKVKSFKLTRIDGGNLRIGTR